MTKKFSQRLVIVSFFLLVILCFISLIKTQTVLSATTHLVISEVQIAGNGSVNEDFIEIYNPTGSGIDLNGYRLVKRTASGTSDSSIKAWSAETIIPAGGYYLWANNSWVPSVTPDTSTASTLAADNGIAIRQGPMDTGTIIDSVAWGSATNAFVETNPFPTNPGAGESIQRNGDDSDNNSLDFFQQTDPNPQNLSFSPSPTQFLTPTPTEIPTPTPTNIPSASPTQTLIPTTAMPSPTTHPILTPTSSPTPTPDGEVIGKFWFPGKTVTCTLSFRVKVHRFFIMLIPKITCN